MAPCMLQTDILLLYIPIVLKTFLLFTLLCTTPHYPCINSRFLLLLYRLCNHNKNIIIL